VLGRRHPACFLTSLSKCTGQEFYTTWFFAYVLMTNHIHLLITPHGEQRLCQAMQTLGHCYVQYYNFCHRRTGTLFEGRHKATLIDSESYLLTCMRYIELNPVRAGMADGPAGYPWSSYGVNALGQANELFAPHLEYLRLGGGGSPPCRLLRPA
jgi:putative transposase